ncbi:hypothetical protein [Corynebacterium sp. ACRQP]|uniref:hypothetical protein n=1 Tax=Corynebacterium sp. ACRQP TaxID=2918195 RepID=UPI001EF5C381|nr:hypothetical protein [Corynebacterium sp. ACRQP]
MSAMSMLRAAHHHGKLSEREYRSHLTSLAARGFRTSEPGSTLQYERSRVFDFVLSSDGGSCVSSIAAETKLPEQDLHALMLSAQPHTISNSAYSTSAPARPALRVVR